MTKSTTKVERKIENQRGKVGIQITLSYAEFGDPFADTIKSECEEFLHSLEKKYMPELFNQPAFGKGE